MDKALTSNQIFKVGQVFNMDNITFDLHKIITFQDLQIFLDDYHDKLSFLGKTQLELIIKDNQWERLLYPVLAVNKFKSLAKIE